MPDKPMPISAVEKLTAHVDERLGRMEEQLSQLSKPVLPPFDLEADLQKLGLGLYPNPLVVNNIKFTVKGKSNRVVQHAKFQGLAGGFRMNIQLPTDFATVVTRNRLLFVLINPSSLIFRLDLLELRQAPFL